MKTKVFFQNGVYTLFEWLFYLVFILIANPVTMFCLNLLYPEGAAKFATGSTRFNAFWRHFYVKCALKWPLWWSKHWITPENLSECGVNKQIAYYWDVNPQQKILKAMSRKAQVLLVKKHGESIGRIIKQMNLTDEMFTEWLKFIRQEENNDKKPFEHWYNLYQELDNYIKSGKLPFAQVMVLARFAVEQEIANNHCESRMITRLYDHIERYGLSQDQFDILMDYLRKNLMSTDGDNQIMVAWSKKCVINEITERLNIYKQRVLAKSQHGVKQTDEWLKFCENTKDICCAAQKEMGLDQYHVFHETGHTLDAGVICQFLCYPDRNLHLMVFQYEPQEVFENEEIKNILDGNVYLRAVFYEEMAKRKRNKSKVYALAELEKIDMGDDEYFIGH